MGGRSVMRSQGLDTARRTGIARTNNASMPDDPRKRTPTEDPPEYRVYRVGDDRPRKGPRPEAASEAGRERQRKDAGPAGRERQRKDAGPASRAQRSSRAARPEAERPYKLYNSRPKGLRARLRGEEGAELPAPVPDPRRERDQLPRERRPWYRPTWRRALAYLGIAVVAWVFLSFVLFMISATEQSGSSILASANPELTPGGNMLTSANTVLILGLDNRPSTGLGSKEPGSNYSERDANTDSIMLWRIGGGVSRRLSIPRDTAVALPGVGTQKINAAWSVGGPALALKTIEQFAGVKINHVIVVDLANFPKFINAIGGVTVTTDKVCSQISGGAAHGGFTLNLSAGTHHLSGEQALVLARTRENACNPAENDLMREKRQQEILNAIKSQLLTPTSFFHRPWASWDAPQAVQTDMGGLTLLSLFAASEMGGSAPTQVLPTSPEALPNGEDALSISPSAVSRAVHKLIDG
jgi:LCP family protein required for cell wall assembly